LFQGELEDVAPLVERPKEFNVLIFLPPALLDMLGTSTMYVGLNLTYASSFQMLRGAVIIFTGLLSVAFLNRVLKWINWIGIIFIMLGLGIVGTCDFIVNSGSGVNVLKNNVITGTVSFQNNCNHIYHINERTKFLYKLCLHFVF